MKNVLDNKWRKSQAYWVIAILVFSTPCLFAGEVAEIDKDGTVIGVYVGNLSWFQKNFPDRTWKQAEEKKVGKGYEFHADVQKFCAPPIYESWVLDKEVMEYKSPVAEPLTEAGEMAIWNEKDLKWDVVTSSK